MASTTSHPPQKIRSRPVRALSTTLGVAILLATLFTALPSQGLANGDFYERLSLLLTPHTSEDTVFTPQPQLRIGIVAGHSGNDSGAVCVDGNGTVTLTEVDVNLEIAAIVQQAVADVFGFNALQLGLPEHDFLRLRIACPQGARAGHPGRLP